MCACPTPTQWLSHNHSALFPAQLAFATCDAILALRLWRPQDAAFISVQFSHSVVSNSETPWTASCQASLSFTISWSWLKLMSFESVMPYNHLILCPPLLLMQVLEVALQLSWEKTVPQTAFVQLFDHKRTKVELNCCFTAIQQNQFLMDQS